MRKSARGSGIYLLFFLSGAAGLVYEVVWSRLLKDVFGVTAHAVAAVLATFLGGLALGSWALGRYADRYDRPLRFYGLLEIGIGIAALAGTLAIAFLDPLHIHAASRFAPDSAALAAVRLVLASAVILPATFLMGGTLPAMTRALVGREGNVSREISFLYALNTSGAVAGSLATGFLLIRALGVHPALWMAVAVNVAVGAWALVLSRQGGPSAAAEPESSGAVEAAPGSRWVLLAIALSGVVSLALEVIWTRMLILIVGSSTHAFVTMLSVFLVGIALGSFIARSLVDRVANPRAAFGWVQAGIAAATLATIPLSGALVLAAQKWLLQMELHWAALTFARFGISFLLLLVPTTLIGMTFPLAAKIRVRSAQRLGSRVGEVYAANTLGNIAGAIIGGFVLLPAAGLQRSVVLLTLLNLAGAAWGLLPRGEAGAGRRLLLRVAPVVAVFLALSGFLVFWRPRPFVSVEEGEGDRVLYYREGLVSTVKVFQRADDGRQLVMLVDGIRIGQSSSGIDYKQQVLAHFPFLLRPAGAIANVLSIGLGTGIVAGEIARHPGVRAIDSVELSPPVIEAARLFSGYNGGVLDNPSVRITTDDGINFLKRTPAKYDAIVSDGKSRLGQAGNALFYSLDYYRSARNHLARGGLMIQWMPLEEIAADLRTIVRTFMAVFSHAYLWVGHGSFFLAGLDEPLVLDLPHIERVLEAPETAHLKRYGWTAAEIAALLVADSASVKEWLAQEDTINSLEKPVLEFYSPRALATPGAARAAENVAAINSLRRAMLQRLPLAGTDAKVLEPDSRALGHLLEALSLIGRGGPGQLEEELALLEKAVATAAPDAGAIRQWAGGILASLGVEADERGDRDQAIRLYRAAIEAWPDDATARVNLAGLLAEGGEPFSAAEQLREVLRANADSGAAHRMLAGILQHTNPPAAIEHFREALRIAPDMAEVHHQLGRCLALAGRNDEALAELREAMRLQPGWAAPMADAALLHATRPDAQARDSSEAIRLALRASELTASKDPGVLEILAASYAAAGRYDEAVEAQRKAVELTSASGDAGLTAAAEGALDLYRRRIPKR